MNQSKEDKKVKSEKNAGKKSTSGPELSKKVFGGVLDYDGAGFYPGLELLNLVYGTSDDNLLPADDVVKIKKRAHDFARRLVWDEGFLSSEEISEVLFDEETEEAVRHLLECLQLPIPNMSKAPGWERAHFFPYTKSLIHWDARKRAGKIKIERRYLRGGGALAFHVIRKDPDQVRLAKCKEGFAKLYSDNDDSALECLSRTLLEHGVEDQVGLEDKIESECILKSDIHEKLLREGVVNILEHDELSTVSRIRSLINWVAFWLLLIQHSRASDYLSRNISSIICDCGASQAQLRRASQRCFKNMESLILDSVEKAANGASIKKQQVNKLRSFFWATAATIKLLNSRTGRRHFTLGLELLETLVLAATSKSSTISYDVFVDEWLFDKCRLVVGRKAAEKSGQLETFDASVFEDNEDHLAVQMKAAGLLVEYSDATRMVGTGGLL